VGAGAGAVGVEAQGMGSAAEGAVGDIVLGGKGDQGIGRARAGGQGAYEELLGQGHLNGGAADLMWLVMQCRAGAD
jgi:hypothetical protein